MSAEDLFRHESARLVSALARLLGPAQLGLAEDVVQDALVSAIEAWPFGMPDDPHAWLFRVAKNRAIDVIRRDRRTVPIDDADLEASVDLALSDAEDDKNQLAMMFACCHESLAEDTHVTLILRFLCGLGPREIAHAYLASTDTIDRRIQRGKKQLESLGRLDDAMTPTRLPSVMRALYLLFSEGYHGSDPRDPLRASMCADALRLAELILKKEPAAEIHALAALFSFDAARLSTRTDEDGVFVPLAEQDRGRWNEELVARGIVHLGASAGGPAFTRFHLEAGIACEHALAPSLEQTNWARIVDLYDELVKLVPGPVVRLNRAVALAELRGPEAGREALAALGDVTTLLPYPFYWAALADAERRAGDPTAAARHYERAIAVSRSRAERIAYERRRDLLR